MQEKQGLCTLSAGAWAKNRARFRGSKVDFWRSRSHFLNLRKIPWRKMALRASGVAI